MLRQSLCLLAAAALSLSGTAAFAQAPPPATTPPPAAPTTDAKATAATVNGHVISEAAVQRALQGVPVAKRDLARSEILNILIENILIEQYLQQLKVEVDPKDVTAKMDAVRAEIKKRDKDWDAWLKGMQLTEAELQQEVTADLRWNKYALSVANDKALHDLFDANKEMFDGSEVRARHIMLTPPKGDAAAGEAARAQLVEIKKQLEQKVVEGLAKLPPNTDNLAREKARVELLNQEFAAVARAKSACESKSEGGDVGYFFRVGPMVEPFSRAAFALKENEMSEIVQTQFGYHLILVTEHKPGKDVKFDEVKNDVREVYCDRLREAMVAQAKQKSTIVIAPLAKP